MYHQWVDFLCYEYTAGNVTSITPSVEHNNSQAYKKTKSPVAMSIVDEIELIELENIQKNNSLDYKENELPDKLRAGVVTLSDNSTSNSIILDKHREDLIFQNPLHAHDYEELIGSEMVNALRKAGDYEEPVSKCWKRLSMPSSLNDVSIESTAHFHRRNSSVFELSSSSNELQISKTEKKPFKIRHYAEFSLHPPQNEVQSTDTKDNQTNSDRSRTSLPSRGVHDYDEPFCRQPLCPVPAPRKLLRKRASDYEVPIVTFPSQKLKSALKLDPPSSTIDPYFNDNIMVKKELLGTEASQEEIKTDSTKSQIEEVKDSQEVDSVSNYHRKPLISKS